MAATSPKLPPVEIRPDVWLDARRALWLPVTRTLVVADLHWGYAVAHRAAGNLLPVWGDEEIAARLLDLVADYRPADMIWLGDSLHALAGRAPAEAFLGRPDLPRTVVVAGNHDLRWSAATEVTLVRDGFVFHHGDGRREIPERSVEIIGHHHPAFVWTDGAGSRLKFPALVDGPRRLILPAFSPWAAGTPWNDDLRPGETLWALTSRRILKVPAR